MRWDLTNLYLSAQDPKIKTDKLIIQKLTKQFIKKYRNQINQKNITGEFFSMAVLDYEKILNKLYLYLSFAGYLKYQNMLSPMRAHFNQLAEEFAEKIQSQLLFLELEITLLPEKQFKTLLQNTKIKPYQNYLTLLRTFKKFRLPEKEEALLNKKNQTGANAFIRLYDELNSSIRYTMQVGSQNLNLNYSELTPYLMMHPDRKIRNKAAKALTTGLEKHSTTFTLIYNTLLFDKKINDDIRQHSYPEEATYLGYQIDKKVVETMSDIICQGYKISEKFYLNKASIIKQKKLTEIDRYSHIYQTKERLFSFTQAKQIILEAFEEFSPIFATIAKKFFDNNWIDAEIRQGKIGGAFCSYCIPEKNPFILVNFTGTSNDITTLAHELGHGIHAYLSRKQPLLTYWSSTVVAEIASIFCEMIVFNKLLNTINDKKLQTNILAEKIQSLFATVFRQNTFFMFEREMHQLRKTAGELPIEKINSLFQKQLQAMFGKGLTLTKQHALWWMSVQHFFHYNFYVFSYTFGEILALSLWGKYQSDSDKFLRNYIKVLEQGSSMAPIEITKSLGLDIENPEFWSKGLNIIAGYVEQFSESVSGDR
ncbi:MAG: M3 family oligoendopeptidase [bacterium]